MRGSPIYFAYGVLVLGTLAVAEYRGWSLNYVNEAQVAPKTVRDNPGAYRPHYGWFPRYFGGK
jgi:hypothetical protein